MGGLILHTLASRFFSKTEAMKPSGAIQKLVSWKSCQEWKLITTPNDLIKFVANLTHDAEEDAFVELIGITSLRSAFRQITVSLGILSSQFTWLAERYFAGQNSPPYF
jgi:hypothetical protein